MCIIFILQSEYGLLENKFIHYINVNIYNYLICKFAFCRSMSSINARN